MSFQDVEKGGVPLPFQDSGRHSDPSQAISAGIFQITTNVATFRRLVNTLGTPKDTLELREKLHKTQMQISQLVKETKSKLKAASESDHFGDVTPAKKIADAKLAKDLQVILTDFQKVVNIAAEREKAFSPFVTQTDKSSSIYPANEPSYLIDDNRKQESAMLLDQRRQDLVLLENEIVFNEALIEERDQGIQEIQQQIAEVNEIFKDLAVLVHEQGVIIDDIDSNIETSHAAVTQANRQLAKASKSQKSNSSLACLLLVIFAVVLVIVIVVIAT